VNGRRRLLGMLAVLGAAGAVNVRGQPASRMPRVGVLLFAEDSQVFKDAFRAGLREHGYEEGRSLQIEWRAAQGSDKRAAQAAAELAAMKVDAIVASLTGAVQAASAETKSIPIVMAPAGGAQLVRNWGRPEGNITGVGGSGSSLGPKWIELFKEFNPALKRVAVVTNRADASFGKTLRSQVEEAGKRLGMDVRAFEVDGRAELESAFAAMEKDRITAAAVQPSLVLPVSRGAELAKLGLRHGVALASQSVEFADSGALLSYGADFRESYRVAAGYVAKLLKGARPGDLPVQRTDRMELVVNVATARALRLPVPGAVRVRADRLVE
jgi:putative tryptophan/tyrosine transport system substrate-binding protein